MNRIISVFLFLTALLLNSSMGQTTFQKKYGGTISKQGLFVQKTYDGGFMIAGVSNSLAPNWTVSGILIRTDSLGNLLWSKVLNGMNRGILAMKQTQDSGTVVLGCDIQTIAYDVYAYTAYIIKLDRTGAIEWSKNLASSEITLYFIVQGIAQTDDGGFIVAGVINMDYEFHAILAKLNKDGDLEWKKLYSPTPINGEDVIQTADGGYLLLGDSYGGASGNLYLIKTDHDGNVILSKSLQGQFGARLLKTHDGGFAIKGMNYVNGSYTSFISFIYKLDANLILRWAKTYNVTFTLLNFLPRSFLETRDGGFLLTWNSFNVAGTDSTGDIIWAKQYGQDTSEYVSYDLCAANNNGFAITGEKGINVSNTDILLFTSDSLGNSGCLDYVINPVASVTSPQVNDLDISAVASNYSEDISVPLNNIDLLEQTISDPPVSFFSFDTHSDSSVVFNKYSKYDMSWKWDLGDGTTDSIHSTFTHYYNQSGNYSVCLTVKNTCGSDTKCRLVTVPEPGAIEEKNPIIIRIYPNPSKDDVVIEWKHFSPDYSLRIYNSLGYLVFRNDQVKDGFMKMERNLFPADGIYVVSITDNQGFAGTAKFIIE
jgi:hypothetical protein